MAQKYWPRTSTHRQVFTGTRVNRAGKTQPICLYRAQATKIRRHIKSKGAANPYDPAWESYFAERTKRQTVEDLRGQPRLQHLWLEQDGQCVVCGQTLTKESGGHLHHLCRRAEGGGEEPANLVLLHPNCHRQVQHQGWPVAKPRPVTRALSKA